MRERYDADEAEMDEPVIRERRGMVASCATFIERRPWDFIGVLAIVALSSTAIANALYFQKGPHPAPLMAAAALPVDTQRETTGSTPAPITPTPVRTTAISPVKPDKLGALIAAGDAPRGTLLADIQRELARKGFYDGTVDGINGPRMTAAIKAFEKAAGLRSGSEPNEALLKALKSSSVRAAPAASIAPEKHASGAAPAPSRRVTAVQKALTDYGYGPLKMSGVVDDMTKKAIQKFERERKLPVQGQVSERFVRELSSVTGRRFE